MASIKELFLSNVAQVVDEPSALEIDHAKGCFLYGLDGKSYLDLISGISVSNVGHSHPRIIEAVTEQVNKHMHLQVYGEFAVTPQALLAEKVLSKLSHCMESVYFVNSGTEAIEGALKIAKKYTGRTELISFTNSYHGSTHGALSIQGSEEFKQGYYPLLPDTRQFDFNSYEVINHISGKTAAVVIECIQSESGYIPAQQEWILAIRAKCTAVGALMILDEIQTGMGRTGTWFAHQGYGFCPDVLCLAKGFGGGMPLGAFIAPKRIMDVIKTNPILGHITTFGGHPVSCAASLAAFDIITEHPQWFQEIPAKSALIELKMVHPSIAKLSGTGLMYCVTLKETIDAGQVISYLENHGVITDYFLFAGNAIRISPPLPITTSELTFGLDTILDALDACT
jgi:acetylornithine/succinyldiaminopimelate/putrescine aminotransferase